MSTMFGVNAVTGLTGLLGCIPMGIQQFMVFPGPLGPSQATAIALGDMTTIPADAYVVPHFKGEISYGGVGAAVSRAGALPGLTAYEHFLGTLPRSPEGGAAQNWGDAVMTDSGGGLSRHLINVVSAGGQDMNREVVAVTVATINALIKAQRNRLESVVFPALGTGIIGRLSDTVAAYTMLGALELFRMRSDTDRLPRMVIIAIYGSLRAFGEWIRIMKMGPSTDEAREAAQAAGQRRFDAEQWRRGIEYETSTKEWIRRRLGVEVDRS